MNRTLAIGGRGTVGREVVSQLAADGAHVRALARNPDAARFSPQVEAVKGDLTLPETLDRPQSGIEKCSWCGQHRPSLSFPSWSGSRSAHAEIVLLSAPLKTVHPFFQQPNPLRALGEQIERLIEAPGLERTLLRPGMFAANALEWWAPQIRAGDVVRARTRGSGICPNRPAVSEPSSSRSPQSVA